MKKGIKELVNKSIAVLEKEVASMRKELAIMIVNSKVNPAKDSNSLIKKKKQ